MRKDKKEAFQLRAEGSSYGAIRARLKIPLGTLSGWFKDVDWSGEMRTRLTEAAKKESSIRMKELDRVRGENLARIYGEAREEAAKELEVFKYNPLFISGLMLYWGEGDKTTRNLVRLSNSDPELIRFYVQFLQKACQIPLNKIKAQILLYPDIEEVANRRFWAFAAGLPIGNFTKSILIGGRHETKRLRYGVCTIVISSSYFKVKMTEWLNLLPKQLIDKRYYENISKSRK